MEYQTENSTIVIYNHLASVEDNNDDEIHEDEDDDDNNNIACHTIMEMIVKKIIATMIMRIQMIMMIMMTTRICIISNLAVSVMVVTVVTLT